MATRESIARRRLTLCAPLAGGERSGMSEYEVSVRERLNRPPASAKGRVGAYRTRRFVSSNRRMTRNESAAEVTRKRESKKSGPTHVLSIGRSDLRGACCPVRVTSIYFLRRARDAVGEEIWISPRAILLRISTNSCRMGAAHFCSIAGMSRPRRTTATMAMNLVPRGS